MNKTYKAYELCKNINKLNGSTIRINSENKVINFDINLNVTSIPHLLGMHYMYNRVEKQNRVFYEDDNKNEIKARDMIHSLFKNHISDDEILSNIKETNLKASVKQRIATLGDFLETLEKSEIVEFTNPNSYISANYLLIQKDDKGRINHLGLKRVGEELYIESYNEGNTYLNTYITKFSDKAFKGTNLYEKTRDIKIYDENLGTYVPFSFHENKNRFYKVLIEKLGAELANKYIDDLIDKDKSLLDNHMFTDEMIEGFNRLDGDMLKKKIDNHISFNDLKDMTELLGSSVYNANQMEEICAGFGRGIDVEEMQEILADDLDYENLKEKIDEALEEKKREKDQEEDFEF